MGGTVCESTKHAADGDLYPFPGNLDAALVGASELVERVGREIEVGDCTTLAAISEANDDALAVA
jgi:hypothetical protein